MTKPESVGFSSERLQRIHDTIQRHIAEKRIPGAVTLVARKGRIVHFEAHGLMNIEAQQPMRKDALFVLASMTKPVTGVAVLMLMEEGKIRLMDPVSKFIPEFKEMKVAVQKDGESQTQLIAAEREITVRDLLTHSSGLGSGKDAMRQGTVMPWPIAPEETLARYVPRWAQAPLEFQPGTRWSYSPHAGIDVLARIVEVASRQSFDKFLRERIFAPLGMMNTFLVLPEKHRERVATIYEVSEQGLTKVNFAVIPFAKTFFSGAIGLVSTAADYLQFAQMLMRGGQWNGQRLLSPRAVELYASNHVGEMFEGQLGHPQGMGFGLTVAMVADGVRAGTLRSNGSFGWGGSYGTYFWADPQQQLVALLMMHTSTAVIGPIQRDFETSVMQALIK